MKLYYLPLLLTVALLTSSIGFARRARGGKKGSSLRTSNVQLAEPGDLPWQGLLISSNDYPICDVILIGPQHLLTSAHCVGKFFYHPESLRVILGEIDNKMENKTFLEVEEVFIDDVDNFWENAKIAMIKLKKPVEFRETIGSIGGIKPIKLARFRNPFPGDILEIGGFNHGFKWDELTLSRGDKVCTQCPPEVGERSGTICTYHERDGNVLKPSGSGLSLYTKRTASQAPKLVGISTHLRASYVGYGRPREYNIYLSVTAYRSWINQILELGIKN